MTLHIFNPEHDIALASGLTNFTAPHAGRQLRHDLGFLPSIWAEEGDIIMVDDVEQAEREYSKTGHRIKKLLGDNALKLPQCQFTSAKATLTYDIDAINPWGWNSALHAQLLRHGIDKQLMPTQRKLDDIRQLSHRCTASVLLPRLRIDGTVGESFECKTPEQVEELLQRYGQLVMKAPWSSSGRGLRFLSVDRTPFALQAGWFRNLVQTQDCVMVEPFYNKVKDFGMEFYSDGQGHISYLGLSLFHTSNGAYQGNILTTELVKQELIGHYIPASLLNETQSIICQELSKVYNGRYCGPFGVDMMIVADGEGFLLHPCVEINLRRTMGHVALALAPKDDDIRCVMRIDYNENKYKLLINRL